MSKLADIRAAVDEYKQLPYDEQLIDTDWVDWLTDLLAIAEAAGEVVSDSNFETYAVVIKPLDNWNKLEGALAKLEGE